MENKDEILSSLEAFSSSEECPEIPTILEDFIKQIAKTGETLFPWSKLKRLVAKKINVSMKKFQELESMDTLPPLPNVENVKYDCLSKRIMERLDEFSGAPFTIQRIAELTVNPKKYYRRTDKYMRGIEKNVMVVSTVDPLGNKIVNESKMFNGGDANGLSMGKDSSLFLPPAPMNSPVVTHTQSAGVEGTSEAAWPRRELDNEASQSTDSFNPETVAAPPTASTSLFSDSNDSPTKGMQSATQDTSSQDSDNSDKSDSSLSSQSSDEAPAQDDLAVGSREGDAVNDSSTGATTAPSLPGSSDAVSLSATVAKSSASSEAETSSSAPSPEDNSKAQPLSHGDEQALHQFAGAESSDVTSSTSTDDLKSKDKAQAMAAEPSSKVSKIGAGDSTGKREAESDVIEGTPPTKKHKSEDEGAVTQDVTISSHDDATAPLAEAETSLSPDPNRRESCGFETNPSCEEEDSVSSQSSTDSSSPAADVTSVSEPATPLNSEAHWTRVECQSSVDDTTDSNIADTGS